MIETPVFALWDSADPDPMSDHLVGLFRSHAHARLYAAAFGGAAVELDQWTQGPPSSSCPPGATWWWGEYSITRLGLNPGPPGRPSPRVFADGSASQDSATIVRDPDRTWTLYDGATVSEPHRARTGAPATWHRLERSLNRQRPGNLLALLASSFVVDPNVPPGSPWLIDTARLARLARYAGEDGIAHAGRPDLTGIGQPVRFVSDPAVTITRICRWCGRRVLRGVDGRGACYSCRQPI